MNFDRMLSAKAHSTSVHGALSPFSSRFDLRIRANAKAASAKSRFVVRSASTNCNTLMMLSNSPTFTSTTSFVPIRLVRREVFQLFTPMLLSISRTRAT